MPRSLVLVEGDSDRTALLTLAGRLGHDLGGVDVVSMGGITNLRRHLADLTGDRTVAVLHDAGETAYVDRTLAGHDGDVARFVCDADLEDELVRALGIPAVLDVVAAAGDLDAWRILLNQPFHRTRPQDAVLRRFWGTTSGRKDKYAALLTAALEPARVPAPLAGVLTAVS
ncbi:hypothetical protein SFC88_15820 [Nocardioides sp. HM23]|uniref:TOPRIM nucleotidyl transferase/hydrolase domain-containing protein n=1 Tax=Nocardioides bizhenqiangii TaxID=3095076 RepID=UPI002ACA1B34|nr:TOPRIM nucleotidyl transferase/hydrolase domain-containing protein [Nocardioides sp. HM23]MDZ5622310.1 hypothetical protein [Nocardioides sp. HM23]